MRAAFAIELLRTHVNQSAAPSLLSRQHAHRITQAASDTEVGDFDFATLIDHQVGWFQVAMNDARAVVRILERITSLACPSAQFKGLKNLLWLVAPQTRQCLAIDIFH